MTRFERRTITFLSVATSASSSDDKAQIHLWDVQSGKLITTIDLAGSRHDYIDFSPVQPILVSSSGLAFVDDSGYSTSLEFWDSSSHRLLVALKGQMVESIIFGPDGRLLAIGGRAGALSVFELRTSNGDPLLFRKR